MTASALSVRRLAIEVVVSEASVGKLKRDNKTVT
jgi:hypothetical protein